MGRLFLIPTPLGNVADLAPRSAELMGSLPVLFCEDTRTTSRLLSKLGIPSPSLLPLHDHNERQVVGAVLARLAAGDAGVVSEAGTPLVSDPGFVAVRAALDAGHEVISVPGPSAVVAALVGSGLPVDRFTFAGFPPRTEGKRRAWLAGLAARPETLVFYESPRRIRPLLADLRACFGARPGALAVNVSKLGERFIRGDLATLEGELAEEEAVRGEMTLVVGGAPEDDDRQRWARAEAAISALVAAGTPAAVIRDVVGSALELPRREVYQRVLAAKEGA